MGYQAIMLTDLDGTLLNTQGVVSPANFQMFSILKQKKVARIAATGRSLYSARKALSPDFPIDYLVFSSGTGILDWASGEIIRSCALNQQQIHAATAILEDADLDFYVHHPIPDTHHFHWRSCGSPHYDFQKRFELLRQFAHPGDYRQVEQSTQLLGVTNDCSKIYPRLQEAVPTLHISPTTSPLHPEVVWLEVFPEGASKGLAGAWLCDLLKIDHAASMSIGNDYNDLAMLEWAKHSFIMANGPEDLKKRFSIAPDHNEDGFAIATRSWLNKLNI